MLAAPHHVVIGNDHSVLNELKNPHTMGVIWRGAFSAPALRFIGGIVEQPDYNTPGQKHIRLRKVLPHEHGKPGAAEFTENLDLLSRLFRTLGSKMLGLSQLVDLSRIEPAHGNNFTRNAGPWHADSVGGLIGLAVPAGFTSDYLPHPIPGHFDEVCFFYPADEAVAEAAVCQLGQADFAVFKAGNFPHLSPGARGLVHRRPNARLESEALTARAVLHWKLDGSPAM
jgi:hypothetical protein